MLKAFLSKSTGVQGQRSDGLSTRPISTAWIFIFGYWPTGESAQQSSTIAEVIDDVKQIASESSDDVLKEEEFQKINKSK